MTNEPKQPGVTPGSQNTANTSFIRCYEDPIDTVFFKDVGLKGHDFSTYPIENALSELISNGFIANQGDGMVLRILLTRAYVEAKKQTSNAHLDRERKIIKHAEKLIELAKLENAAYRSYDVYNKETEKFEYIIVCHQRVWNI